MYVQEALSALFHSMSSQCYSNIESAVNAPCRYQIMKLNLLPVQNGQITSI